MEVRHGEGRFVETCSRSEAWLYGGWLVHKGCSWGLWGESLEYIQRGWDKFSHLYQMKWEMVLA